MIDTSVTCLAIVLICYLAAEAVKNTSLDTKWIPLICGGLGLILGVSGFYLIPQFPADNLLTAITVGIVSGLAATGANQAIKKTIEKITGGNGDDDT